MRIGSLFSGIGGLELGLEWAGLGETVWQVEIDPFCRSRLAKHWPSVKRYEDVKAIGSCDLCPVDLICGGFPCQDISSAGKRAGLAGARSGLWFEYLRIVSELRPAWVVVENVASGADVWVDTVHAGLAERGYVCFSIPLSAADVGAPHIRERVFVLARHTDAHPQSMGAEHAQVERMSRASDTFPGWANYPDLSVVDGLPCELAALGNAVVPACAEVIGHVIRLIEAPIAGGLIGDK